MIEKVYSADGEIFGNVELDDLEGECCYYSGDSLPIKPSELITQWVVDDILERMDERLYDECGDVSEDAIRIENSAKEELKAFIMDFMDKHCKVSCYKVENVKFHELPPDDCLRCN